MQNLTLSKFNNMRIFNPRKISALGKLIVLLILTYLLVSLLFTKTSYNFQGNCRTHTTGITDNGHILSTTCSGRNILNNSQVKLYSNRETNKQYYLTIGMPTIMRKNGIDYLIKTLNSLVDQHRENKKLDILIVIQLGDMNEDVKKKLGEMIKNRYEIFIATGVMDVIQVPPEYYPSSQRKLKRKFGDSEKRIKWRSKQVLDFSFLFCYCYGLAAYHVQLEDDVVASSGYFLKLKNFIEEYERKENWFTLDASVLGYIGKVYHNHDLKEISSFYYLFFDEMPVDWLEYKWRLIKGQVGFWRLRAASLFQHVGVVSSMTDKKQLARESYFDNHTQKFLGLNPSAKLYTDLTGHNNLKIEKAYEKGGGYFWAQCLKKDSCFIKIIFQETVMVKRIVIETGANFAVNDTIHMGSLEYGTTVQGKDCLHYNNKSPMKVKHGSVDVSFSEEIKTDCFKLVIQKQMEWVCIREINIWNK